VRIRAGRRGRSGSGVRGDAENAPAGHKPRHGRARWFSRSPFRATLVTALALGVIVTVSPANGAAGDIAAGFVRAVQHLTSPSRNGEAFAGTPAVGALFTTSNGKLKRHFCSASVVDSPAGDLVITAAHCVSGASGTLAFVPGYDNGMAPYRVWTVTRIYVDHAWQTSADPDDDVAFLRVGQSWSSVPIEDVTGAERLGTGTPQGRQLVDVIGYPNAFNQPITCRNWLKRPMKDQLEFDCGGYTDGTSGGPFLLQVSQKTGQGTVIGVIGGYEQGGDIPQVSYSSAFGATVAALYQTAVAGGLSDRGRKAAARRHTVAASDGGSRPADAG
jgi:V8-like Glu-specific endopeptidase